MLQTSADAIYGARHVALKAGVPIDVPALTVNRLCGSGIQAAVSGAQMIQLGEADLVLTGGMESMSQAPHVIRGLRSGLQARPGHSSRTRCGQALLDTLLRLHDGDDRRELRREVRHQPRGAGRYALRSQQLADAAWQEGRFAEEIVPVEIKTRKGVEVVRPQTITCGPRRRWRAWRSCRRRSSKDGRVTAGNASGIVDGGAALILASREARDGIRPEAARPPVAVGIRRRRADADGDGPGAGDAQGARRRPA